MKINKKIINKIEGEATLKIHEKKDIIEFVEIEFWQYRGIEKYLQNRPYMDALVINPRVCGICGHSHLLATAEAIENAFGAKITQKAKILREITTGLEIIQNHIKWFYITLFPTQIKDRSFTLKALKLSSFISKIIALISGQFPHNSYIIPGGVTCDLTNLEIFKLEDMLKILMDEIQAVINKEGNSRDLEQFFENLPKNIGKSLNRFLVLGDNLYFSKNGKIEKIKEKKTTSLYSNVFYEDKFYEVGPLARNINNPLVKKIYEKYEDSIYTRIFARLYEINLIIEYLLENIKNIDVCEPSYIAPKVKNAFGISVIEAPRGSLIHKVEIKDGKIKYYEIIVPTQFNLSNGTKNNPSAAQAALMNERKEYLDTIFKCFDICAVCVTH
ncbi:MAG: nickel-dependent hydrogenase large subunit [Nautiliaceae bacterium]